MHIVCIKKMAKLSEQIREQRISPERLSRTQRQIARQQQQVTEIQEPLPEGSLVKADVQAKLKEEREKANQIQTEKQEEWKRITKTGVLGESQRRNFYEKWNIKIEVQKARIRVLRDLNNQMGSSSYIGKGKLESYLRSASQRTGKEYEVSERASRRYSQELEEKRAREGKVVVIEPIDPEKYLLGLEQVEVKKLRRAEGGFSEVTILSGDDRKVQVVRALDTGEVRIVELKGKKKGAVLVGKGYSSKEIQAQIEAQALAELKKRKLERKPFVDIEALKVKKEDVVFFQKTGMFITDIPLKIKSAISKIPIPIFTAGKGVTSIDLGEVAETLKIKKYLDIGVTKTIKGAGKVISYGRELTGDLGIPIFTGGVGTVQLFPVKKGKEDISKIISEKELEMFSLDLEKRGLTETYKPKFEVEYQAKFEDKYGKKIISGEITFEEAEKKFKESAEAKKVAERYQRTIDIERGKKITIESAKLWGLSSVKLGVKLIPESPSDIVLETAVISGAIYSIGKVPKSVINVAYGVGGVWGTATALDPRFSPEKRVGGIVLAGVSFGMLGLHGLKYLRRPTIKAVRIEAPRLTLKTEAIAKEGRIIEGKVGGVSRKIEEVVFAKQQKLQQIGVAGRRTVISTKWRDILKLDPVYRGVPTAQRGTTYTLKSLRGTYIYKTPSGYQKAIDLLTKRMKLSEGVAKGVSRYTAPKVIDVTLEKGILKVAEQEAVGKFVFRIDQPILKVDELLGIKTRGAKSIRDYYKIQRSMVDSKIITDIKKTTTFVTKEGASYNLLKQIGKTQTRFVQGSKIKVGDIESSFIYTKPIRVEGGALIDKRVLYQSQELIEKYVRQQTIPFKRQPIIGKDQTLLIKAQEGRIIVSADLDELRGVSYDKFIQPAQIQKTPLWKTFAKDTKIEKIKDIIYKQPKPFTYEITKEIGKQQVKEIIKDTSRYTGRGLYERTEGIAGDFQSLINNELKSSFVPTVNIKSQIKNLMKLDQLIIPSSTTKLGLGVLSALELSSALKSDIKLDTDFALKSNLQLKNLLKEATILKTGQVLKTGQALKLSQVLKSTYTIPTSSIFLEPIIPKFKVPATPTVPVIFGLPTARSLLKQKIREKKLMQELLYLPDFTARALGLGAETLTMKQAQKKIGRIQTGFEVRRPIRISNKNLLKGIPA